MGTPPHDDDLGTAGGTSPGSVGGPGSSRSTGGPTTAPAGTAGTTGAFAPTRGDRAAAWFTHAGKVTVIALIAVAVLIAVYLAASAFLPRWWAQVIGRQVDGSMGQGTAWGLFYGFLFTLVPVLVVSLVRRRWAQTWKARVIIVVVALLIALPNWLTLWIVLGGSNAAHAGERILDVQAPGFRAATLMGAIAGLLIGLTLTFTAVWVRRRRQAFAQREAALTAREAALGEPPR
ncbi:hypothetical protein C8046_10000 [Serinibacter arcticus]|uniref:Permease n=1 Tax=Serinibacter arcticus TaxID=1655435 RepID=A0A2U1ZVD9_9MICO|nr:hypothetical protein [Serinibacter arcticus]PWD50934.1 hypothetical protein C8046_10000 [Serinibacter arcticus]